MMLQCNYHWYHPYQTSEGYIVLEGLELVLKGRTKRWATNILSMEILVNISMSSSYEDEQIKNIA